MHRDAPLAPRHASAVQSIHLMNCAKLLTCAWNRALRCLVACAPALAAAGAQAQIYAGVSDSGGIVLSNHASQATPTLYVSGAPTPRADLVPTLVPEANVQPAAQAPTAAPAALVPMIRDAAREHALSATVLTAVIAAESGFNPRAVSRKGAQGLMQLMPETARRFGVKDAFSVRDNLRGGATYLRELLRLFEGDLSLALAAYNAGEGAVQRAGRRIPPYRETQDYVAKVLAYAGLADGTGPAIFPGADPQPPWVGGPIQH